MLNSQIRDGLPKIPMKYICHLFKVSRGEEWHCIPLLSKMPLNLKFRVSLGKGHRQLFGDTLQIPLLLFCHKLESYLPRDLLPEQ
jgi:hypothetical protein